MEFDLTVTSLSVLEMIVLITAKDIRNRINEAMRKPTMDANVYLRKLFIIIGFYAWTKITKILIVLFLCVLLFAMF